MSRTSVTLEIAGALAVQYALSRLLAAGTCEAADREEHDLAPHLVVPVQGGAGRPPVASVNR